MSTGERKPGKVYLAGAGPGDPGLVTLRCAQCLAQSDAVVYDKLVNREILRYAPVQARLIYVGKEADHHSMKQEEINVLLGELAAQGLIVTRLKGGDPFLFGRGGEEAGFLRTAGIDFEIIPGVSSAFAVPAYAGIPLTHRSVNGSVHIVTGHEEVDGVGPEVDWECLARGRGTIAFLMGVGNLESITRRLMAAGMQGTVPAALIEWGTTPEQRVVEGTLETLVLRAAEEKIKPPAVGIIGGVVALRNDIAWAERRRLHGWRVAITRTGNDFTAYQEALANEGAESMAFNLTSVSPREPDASDLKKLLDLESGRFQWIIFSSGNAVATFRNWIWKSGNDSRILANCNVAVVGTATGARVESDLAVRPELIATDSRQEGLVDLLKGESGPIYWPRAASARPFLRQELSEHGIEIEESILYDTIHDPAEAERLSAAVRDGRIQAAIFTSSANFRQWWEGLNGDDRSTIETSVTLVAIGPQTADEIRRASPQVALVVSDKPDAGSVVEALASHASRGK